METIKTSVQKEEIKFLTDKAQKTLGAGGYMSCICLNPGV
jgi:hypothetical protein